MHFTKQFLQTRSSHCIAVQRHVSRRAQPIICSSSIPTKLNNIPHTREIRKHFYEEASTATIKALASGELRVTVQCTIPELNTEFDVYRVGTLLELAREIATKIAANGKTVKVCVQQALGSGVFQGTPLSLSGVMRIMTQMDWGDATDFVKLGNLGAKEVADADAFLLIAPQNITGHSVLPLLEEMTDAAAAQKKPMILINPKLTDIPSSGGVMSVRGRQERMDYVASFVQAYLFRLLYLGAGPYPIMGALRYSYSGVWEVYKRIVGEVQGEEEYVKIGAFDKRPDSKEITETFKSSKA